MGSSSALNAASLVRELSIQTDKLDQLLQTNEAAQNEIHQLQQNREFLSLKCQSLQHSEGEKIRKISMLEKKIDELENIVIDMKLSEAESRSREDHYKLQIAHLEQLLNIGAGQDRKRSDGSNFAQYLTSRTRSRITSNNSGSDVGEQEERNHLLNVSFTSFFGKSANDSDANSKLLKLTVTKQQPEKDSVGSPKPKVVIQEDQDQDGYEAHEKDDDEEKIINVSTTNKISCNPSTANDSSDRKEVGDSSSSATRPPPFISVRVSSKRGLAFVPVERVVTTSHKKCTVKEVTRQSKER